MFILNSDCIMKEQKLKTKQKFVCVFSTFPDTRTHRPESKVVNGKKKKEKKKKKI